MMNLFLLLSLVLMMISLPATTAMMSSPNNGNNGGMMASGDCPAGKPNVGGGHMMMSGSGSTVETIGKGGFVVLLDSKPITPNVGANVTIGTQHVLTVKSTGSSVFRGLFIRLGPGASGVRTKSALTVVSGDTKLQVVKACTSIGVGGVTETSYTSKKFASAHLLLSQKGKNLPLDVTIEVQDSMMDNSYYYSRYNLNAV